MMNAVYEKIALEGSPTWAIPENPEVFFQLLEKPDLTGEEVDRLLDLAGRLSPEVCERQWSILCQGGSGKVKGCSVLSDGEVVGVLTKEMFDKLLRPVVLYFLRKVRRSDIAEELALKSLAKAGRTYNPEKECKFETFLFNTVCDTTLKDWLRSKEGRHSSLPLERVKEPANREQAELPVEVLPDAVLSAIKALPDQEREMINAALMHPHWTIKKLGESLGISEGLAYRIRQKALRKLRDQLGGETDDAIV